MTSAAVTPAVTFSGDNLVSTSLTLDGAPFASGTTVGAEGPHVLVAEVTDCAGNTSTETVSFFIDRTPPAIAIAGVTDGQITNQDVTPVVTFTDPNLGATSITLNGAPFVSGSTITAEDVYVLVAQATDLAGNTATETVTFVIDKTAPVITVAGVVDGQCTGSPVIPTFSASDPNLATVEATLDGAPFASGTPITTEGTFVLEVTATDLAGNTSTETVSFTVDDTPPAIAISGFTDGEVTSLDLVPVVAFSDANLVSTTLELDGLSFVSGTTVSTEGTHVLVAEATDCAGNTSSETQSFTIDKTPPVITIRA